MAAWYHMNQARRRAYQLYRSSLIGLCSFCIWLVCVVASWSVWSHVDFLYGAWYQWLNIGHTIEVYSVQNRYGKQSFKHTSFDEHRRLFTQINRSVQAGGKGLENIQYRVMDHQGHIKGYPLLTSAEVVHLQDVSRLVDRLYHVGIVAGVIAVLSLLLIYRQSWNLPSLLYQLAVVGVLIGVVAGAIVLLGAKQVFYWLHIQLFPPQHQWFFYYQDSLMSTLMQAPNLFAPIAVVWLLLAVLLWIVVMAMLVAWCNSYRPGKKQTGKKNPT